MAHILKGDIGVLGRIGWFAFWMAPDSMALHRIWVSFLGVLGTSSSYTIRLDQYKQYEKFY